MGSASRLTRGWLSTLRAGTCRGCPCWPAPARPGPRPGALVNALPKAGTHLLIRLMELLPGMSRVRLQTSWLTRWRFAARDDEPVLDVGVAWPDVVSRRRVARALALLPAGSFATAHVPHTVDFADVLRDLDLRMVLMIRDPRDVAVSSAEYLST